MHNVAALRAAWAVRVTRRQDKRGEGCRGTRRGRGLGTRRKEGGRRGGTKGGGEGARFPNTEASFTTARSEVRSRDCIREWRTRVIYGAKSIALMRDGAVRYCASSFSRIAEDRVDKVPEGQRRLADY